MNDFGNTINEMDVEAFLNIRNWVEDAISDKGAEVVSAGLGNGRADLQFVLEGHKYNITVKPI